MNRLPGLVIVGAGGFGREMVAWSRQSVQYQRDWVLKGLIDDNPNALAGKNCALPILGSIRDYQPQEDEIFICALGVPAVKRKCTELLLDRGARFTQVIHQTAVLGDNVDLGEGVVMCPFSIASANNRLGRGVTLNLHASVDHDVNVDDWSQLSCHCDLTAAVQIGKEVFLGSSVAVIPGVRVGDGAYVGAGAVVVRDVPPGAKVFGVPARLR